MPLNNKDKLDLIKKAHSLNPLIIVGQKGVTDSLLNETDIALYDHELIKIKVNADSKSDVTLIADHICDALKAINLKVIGKTAIIYRKSDKNENKLADKSKTNSKKRSTKGTRNKNVDLKQDKRKRK